MSEQRWWHLGLRRPPEDWEGRVKADLAASAPGAVVQAGDGPLVPVTSMPIEIEAGGPGRSESVREYLLRTPHEFEENRGSLAMPIPCACGKWLGSGIHYGAALLDTREYLAGISAALDELTLAGHEVPPLAEARADTVAPALAVPPLSATEAAGDDAPETTPLPPIRKPEPLPDGVIGYGVASRRTVTGGDGTLAWLTSADAMTREHAEHVLTVTGGTLVEIRAVEP